MGAGTRSVTTTVSSGADDAELPKSGVLDELDNATLATARFVLIRITLLLNIFGIFTGLIFSIVTPGAMLRA
ncbi:hypothetical protein, partial [Streptomyces sp. NPDC056632]|uniref:hypothetical protein n=1 Tax=Streptomyces sp. NPDC056632 TaxID=3345884 RepID=UPI00368E4B28